MIMLLINSTKFWHLCKRISKNAWYGIQRTKISLSCINKNLDKILKKEHIGVTFTPPNTIKRMVNSTKYLFDPSMYKGIYAIPSYFGMVYIGEANILMKVRFKENNIDLRLNGTHASTLLKHSSRTNHQILLENAKAINKVDHDMRRKLMESLKI